MKPIFTEDELSDIWFKLADGEPLDNETAVALFQENCFFAGEYYKRQYEQRREELYAS